MNRVFSGYVAPHHRSLICTVNYRRRYFPLELQNLAEGIQKISESTEPACCRESSLTVHGVLAIKSYLPGEGSQTGVAHEGRDNTDSQDAAMTTFETQWYPNCILHEIYKSASGFHRVDRITLAHPPIEWRKRDENFAHSTEEARP